MTLTIKKKVEIYNNIKINKNKLLLINKLCKLTI